MDNQRFNTPCNTHALRDSAMSAKPGGNESAMPIHKARDDAHHLFQDLAQSLAVLSGAYELLIERKRSDPTSQMVRVWLQPPARRAEAAMHQLRELHLTRSPAVTDLSQSLTVLVLAADMLAHDQFSGEEAPSFYSLLRRNAAVAMRSLSELRAHADFAAQAAQN